MAHTCPNCDQVCHCHGDIDDCILNLPKDQNNCIHYLICEYLDDEEDYDPRTADEMW